MPGLSQVIHVSTKYRSPRASMAQLAWKVPQITLTLFYTTIHLSFESGLMSALEKKQLREYRGCGSIICALTVKMNN